MQCAAPSGETKGLLMLLFDSDQDAQLEIAPLTKNIGARINGLDISKPLSNLHVRAIRAALYQHQVLLFRGQNLNLAEQENFAKQFGALKLYEPQEWGSTPSPHTVYISNVKTGGLLKDGNLMWHTDSAFMEAPPSLSFLFSEVVPNEGGDTYWTNMYLALSNLPTELRAQIEKLSVLHDNKYNTLDEPRELLKNSLRTGAPILDGAVHSLIQKHPGTGKECLYYGRTGRNKVVGLDDEAGAKLLLTLEEHSTRPEFVLRHHWQPGDLIIWDNRCTMHRRDAFDPRTPRTLRRCEVYDRG